MPEIMKSARGVSILSETQTTNSLHCEKNIPKHIDDENNFGWQMNLQFVLFKSKKKKSGQNTVKIRFA